MVQMKVLVQFLRVFGYIVYVYVPSQYKKNFRKKEKKYIYSLVVVVSKKVTDYVI